MHLDSIACLFVGCRSQIYISVDIDGRAFHEISGRSVMNTLISSNHRSLLHQVVIGLSLIANIMYQNCCHDK